MFQHQHPYPPFIQKESTKLIVGTLPPPRFTTGELNENDVNFCYGSSNGQLWKILDRIFKLGLRYETTQTAIDQRRNFLLQNQIGVCDIVESCERNKIDASDLGMVNIKLRDILNILKNYPAVHTLLLMGGNSKNGPEFHLRKILKDQNIKLKVSRSEVPRIHEFDLKPNRKVKIISLTAPSGAANRAVGSNPQYKIMKQQNPNFNTLDFRVLQYKQFF